MTTNFLMRTLSLKKGSNSVQSEWINRRAKTKSSFYLFTKHNTSYHIKYRQGHPYFTQSTLTLPTFYYVIHPIHKLMLHSKLQVVII